MSVSRNMKSVYVALAHGAGRVGSAVGFLPWLDRHAQTSRRAHWARSLFAIHDVDSLVALDVPWWTYAAIDRVDAFLASRPQARVFEYGSGASTVWLARRSGVVTSVEHVPGWHARVQDLLSSLDLQATVTLRLVEPDTIPPSDPLYRSQKPGEVGMTFSNYASAIEDDGGLFDLIVVDGRARPACLHHAVQHLSPGGMIVFDNSNRPRYQKGIEGSGLSAQRLRGLTPSLPYPDETTLLSQASNEG